MPRAFMTEHQRNQAADKEADAVLIKRIKATASALGLSGEGFAARIGMSYGTFNRRMHKPETFTLKEYREIERLYKKGGFTEWETSA